MLRAYSFDDLLRIAKKLALIARRRVADLPKLPLPALVMLSDGGSAILLKIDDTGETGTRYLVMPANAERQGAGTRPLEERMGEGRAVADKSREHIAGESAPSTSRGPFPRSSDSLRRFNVVPVRLGA